MMIAQSHAPNSPRAIRNSPKKNPPYGPKPHKTGAPGAVRIDSLQQLALPLSASEMPGGTTLARSMLTDGSAQQNASSPMAEESGPHRSLDRAGLFLRPCSVGTARFAA